MSENIFNITGKAHRTARKIEAPTLFESARRAAVKKEARRYKKEKARHKEAVRRNRR